METLGGFGVSALPTMIFFDAQGEEAGRLLGARPAPQIIATARRIVP